MKKTIGSTVLVVLITLAFTSMQVFASPIVEKGKPSKTPGVKTTERAMERATEDASQPTGKPGGKPEDKGKPDNKGKLEGKKQNFKGIVASIDDTSLTLTLKDESSVTLVLDGNTRIQIPSMAEPKPVDIPIGSQVKVQVVIGPEDSLTALHVIMIPGKPSPIHHVGIVSNYQPGVSISITTKKDNQPYTFIIDPSVKILPAERADQLVVGVRVTIISSRDVTGAAPSARGIVVHPIKGSLTLEDKPEIESTLAP